MNLNTEIWQDFKMSSLFEMKNGFFNNKPEVVCTRTVSSIPFLGATAENNGITDYCDIGSIESSSRTGENDNTLEGKIFEGNCITITNNGSVCYAYFQPRAFTSSHDETICIPKFELNMPKAMFICSIINKERYKWSYGRKLHDINKSKNIIIKLPIQYNTDGSPLLDNTFKYSDQGYVPDWQFMEDYIQSLHYKPLTTKRVNENKMELNVSQWEEFYVGDVFKIKYGINMELNACEECDMNDSESVAFVARTAENNGVSAYVKKEKGKVPQKAGTITCAGGGSVLSTFVQFHDFYSGRDLYLLNEKEALSIKTKLFLTTIILKNQYKYSYGRQANKTLPSLVLKLPIQRNTNGIPVIDKEKKYHNKGYIPDWQFMEDYINSLPYSDRI